MSKVIIITAVGTADEQGRYPIGVGGKLPWHHKEDLKWFKETTMGHVIICGRKTFESMGVLPGRRTVVISSQNYPSDGTYDVYSSLEDALEHYKDEEKVFIVGGATLYKYAIDNQIADEIWMDHLSINVSDADTFFPVKVNDFTLGGKYSLNAVEEIANDADVYKYKIRYGLGDRINTVDAEYLELIKDILENGSHKHTRSGDTLSVFGRHMYMGLYNGLPVLTTKKMFMKGCIHELLWFLKGDTNIKYLVDNGVHIWDDDAYRYYRTKVLPISGVSKEEFLEKVKKGDKEGSMYTYGDLGPVYGKQWRNFGDLNTVDQIKNLIDTLRTNPDDRRMLVTAWNPAFLNDMALPPCHYSFQVYTREFYDQHERLDMYMCYHPDTVLPEQPYDVKEFLDSINAPTRTISLLWNQRSVDCCLGLPFNIMSYAVLCFMIAQCVNMLPEELIFNGGDCHIYENQIEGIKEQMEREVYRYRLPKLVLNKEIKEITDFTFDDIKIEDYKSYPAIKMPLSVG